MRKFKKFYIALLGGILALGVGTSSLVSSVSPTAVKAYTDNVVFTFDDWGESEIRQSYTAETETVILTMDSFSEETRFNYDFDEEAVELYATNELNIYVSSEIGGSGNAQITCITFTFLSGTVNNFSNSNDYITDVEFTRDGDDTLLYDFEETILIFVTDTIKIKQISVTVEFGLYRAILWAQEFLNLITCDGKGNKYFDERAWQQIGNSYNYLSTESKAYFTDSDLTNSNADIKAVVTRYDYIINKYGTTDYPDFIGRFSLDESSNITNVSNSVDYITIIAITVSVLALTSIAAFIIIYRKRKLSSK